MPWELHFCSSRLHLASQSRPIHEVGLLKETTNYLGPENASKEASSRRWKALAAAGLL